MNFGDGKIDINWEKGVIESLQYKDRVLVSSPQPIFRVGLRDEKGNQIIILSEEGKYESPEYQFDGIANVKICVEVVFDKLFLNASVQVKNNYIAEFIDFIPLKLDGKLIDNGGDGKVLWPYNEGGIVTDGNRKPFMDDPVYPSKGNYAMFPYMLSSQFLCYLFGENGLYIACEDVLRGPKSFDFFCDDNNTTFRIRIFLGGNSEAAPIALKFFQGDWMDGAEIYREWFYQHKPTNLKTIRENFNLPAWYREEMPVVVTYPVRGIHDMDKMDPNKLFPYENVLPLVEEFSKKMHTKIMVLLMHWEGTAPWAPPYVWPPYGGEEMLLSFMKKLHDNGNLLGVYCSGLGWTEQSNLIESYNTENLFKENRLEEAMCISPEGELPYSRICTGQRRGFDICPRSEKGFKILKEALTPLFNANLDYMQVMDQNHGGSMYFCYSKNHGHPGVPGPWMTETMKNLTKSWQESCPNGLLGCESAAAEPYIENLLLSDNRYELNYFYGKPVPLYSFLYHEYLHNFMGNQVCAPFAYNTEGILFRLAYSFSAGDLLTLVINDDGEIMFHWGMRDFSHHSDKEKILTFCKNLHYAEVSFKEFLADGKMVKPLKYECENTKISMTDGVPDLIEPSVISTAYESSDGKKVQFFVNYTDKPVMIKFSDKSLKVPPLDVITLEI